MRSRAATPPLRSISCAIYSIQGETAIGILLATHFADDPQPSSGEGPDGTPSSSRPQAPFAFISTLNRLPAKGNRTFAAKKMAPSTVTLSESPR